MEHVLSNTRLMSPASLCPLVCAKCLDILGQAVPLLPPDNALRGRLIEPLVYALFSLPCDKLLVGSCFVLLFLFLCFINTLSKNLGRLTWVGLQPPQEQCCPFVRVCVLFSCAQTVLWLPVLGVFNICPDVSACNFT